MFTQFFPRNRPILCIENDFHNKNNAKRNIDTCTLKI